MVYKVCNDALSVHLQYGILNIKKLKELHIDGNNCNIQQDVSASRKPMQCFTGSIFTLWQDRMYLIIALSALHFRSQNDCKVCSSLIQS